MANDLTTLNGSYDNIVTLFNNYDAAGLGNVMDPACVLKKVLHPDSVFGGIDTIVSYLKNDMFVGKPVFTPDTTSLKYHPNVSTIQTNAVYAHVRGTGTYQDTPKDTQVNVAFVWCFTRAAPNTNWMLVNAYGAPMDTKNF
jgi:hypothetical protein